MVFDFIALVLKYLIYALTGLLVYYLYNFIISPLMVRRHYSKYPNVYITQFVPFFGDFWHYVKNIKKGNVYYAHLRHEAKELMSPKYDFKLFFEGKIPVLHTVSTQARKEMQALMPTKIDRYPLFKGFNKFLLNS